MTPLAFRAPIPGLFVLASDHSVDSFAGIFVLPYKTLYASAESHTVPQGKEMERHGSALAWADGGWLFGGVSVPPWKFCSLEGVEKGSPTRTGRFRHCGEA